MRNNLFRCGGSLIIIVLAILVMTEKINAGGVEKEIAGNRGYLVGGPVGKEGPEVKAKEKKTRVKRQGVKPEFFKAKAAEVEKHIQATKTVDQSVPEKKGDIGPKGYLVGTPEEKKAVKEKERGRGGFAEGTRVAIEELKKLNRQIKNRPYPADQTVEGSKGNYIYGEPPLETEAPEKGLTRHAGLKPTEVIPSLVKGLENLHQTWNIKPARSQDKEIWGFKFPDMPKEEKKGITKHRGNPAKTTQSFIETIGADIEKHKANAPVDK